MPPLPSSQFSPLLLLIVLFTIVPAFAQDGEMEGVFLTYCSGDNFTSSSPYDSNLRRLFAGLITSTPKSRSFFSTDTVGASSSPAVVFGLAQCRPDVSAATCSSCLNQSAATAPSLSGCGNRKSASLRSGACVLRYSDQSFFNILETTMTVRGIRTVQNSWNPLDPNVQNLMANLTASAAAAPLRYAAAEQGQPAVYGMGWCTMDLSSMDCQMCLEMAMAGLKQGNNISVDATVSCHARIESSRFFSVTSAVLQAYSPAVSPAPPPVTSPATREKKNKNATTIIVCVAVGAVLSLLLFLTACILLLRRRTRRLIPVELGLGARDQGKMIYAEIQAYDFATVKACTNNFAKENKLGQGGFGPVYKGVLANGQEVAVKRLATTSVQGFAEMKNEINYVAKLQHKNLVKLLGYCLHDEEKLLVYEFLPNTSLDKLLFDPIKRIQLDWSTRFKIIVGIAKGLLYLHEESHFKIIHRDLKASNILLDANLSPKISDFGLAKLFDVDETERNTSRIAGTLGYMAPEYVLHGLFSTKSDVFSYGVLVLEIITGERNSFVEGSMDTVDILSHVWGRWKKGKGLQVIDKTLGDDGYPQQDALRCMQIGLLCVQEEQVQRPNMVSVMTMLNSPLMALPAPSEPAFLTERSFSLDAHAQSSRRMIAREPELPMLRHTASSNLDEV
ncbi:Cysteine-rich receptor-like protein kinase 10 [Apostasia shenzhenica]|uniref:Cysteine-rich receptor-like protein kinase 10 n=1 Tax=Apostasia shenzhenica TaxID=1088818 RepID=A0A2H9ZSW1_9ASPA|nr:Cysteine-rich receptor-like protein kinase 10 [Apostasia shenzhenica]